MKSATLKQFRPEAFLSQSGVGRAIVEIPKKKTLFSQGDPGDSVYYIQKGRARLSVVSGTGKEATVAVLGPGNFVGADCVAGLRSFRLSSAGATPPPTPPTTENTGTNSTPPKETRNS